MSYDSVPINPDTLAHLRTLLCAFTRNMGGDAQQLEKNLQPPLTIDNLQAAMQPLLVCNLLRAGFHQEDGEAFSLFSYSIKPLADKDEDENREVTTILISIMFHHPNLPEPVEWVRLAATSGFHGVSSPGAALNSKHEEGNDGNIKDFKAFMENLSDMMGDPISEALQELLIAAMNAISPDVLSPTGREIQDELNQAFGGAATGLGGNPLELPLTEEMTARVQAILRFMEAVFDLEDSALVDLFEPHLVQLVQDGERLTFGGLLESAFTHPDIQDMTPVAVKNVSGEINLMAFKIPLRDDDDNVLDTLIIAFSTDNISVELESGNMSLAETLTDGATLKGADIIRLAQASANADRLQFALKKLAATATGDAKKKVREALLALTAAS